MSSRRVTFPNDAGLNLVGRLDLPTDRDPVGMALFAHCFTCTKDSKGGVHISRELVRHGFGVLRFDFTGLGESQGDFAASNFQTNIADLHAAARFLARDHQAPTIIIGHSFGGAAVLVAVERMASVRAVVTVAAPRHPAHIAHHFVHRADEIREIGSAMVKIGGRPFKITKQFLDDVESADIDAAIAGLDRPLLVCHSPTDQIVGIENAAEIYAAARHPKSFLSLDTADHLLLKQTDAAYAGRVIAAWASR